MIRRVLWLSLFIYMLSVVCFAAGVLLPRDQRVVPVLLWCIGVLYLVAVFSLPARVGGDGPVPGGCPPSPGTVLARQVHPTRGLSDDVCRRICTELEGQFVEDDTARRTTLNREDGE